MICATGKAQPFPAMKKIIALSLFVLGLALVYFGFEASNSIESTMSEVVHGASSNKSLLLTLLGAATALGAFIGLARSS